MGVLKRGLDQINQIVTEEIDDPRKWEAELAGQSNTEDQQR